MWRELLVSSQVLCHKSLGGDYYVQVYAACYRNFVVGWELGNPTKSVARLVIVILRLIYYCVVHLPVGVALIADDWL